MVSDDFTTLAIGTLIGLNPCSNGIWSLTAGVARFGLAHGVLILVLMEYGLWRSVQQGSVLKLSLVLILVLMEYGLWPNTAASLAGVAARLNPCSNGIWSLTKYTWITYILNLVLILVLMEYGLWHTPIFPLRNSYKVLILVLMEYGLWLLN